jgi:hypothetical protein
VAGGALSLYGYVILKNNGHGSWMRWIDYFRRHKIIVETNKTDKSAPPAYSRSAIMPTMRPTIQAFVALLALSYRVNAQNTALCPRDETVVGYSSLEDINDDMQTELRRIRQGGVPSDSYTFRLCPSKVFDASTTTLLPVLSNSLFVCGSGGNRNDNCIILGGSEQVRIVDSTLASFPLKRLTFMGITFADFKGNDAATGTCISALANSQTTASFLDVAFTVSQNRERECRPKWKSLLTSCFF